MGCRQSRHHVAKAVENAGDGGDPARADAILPESADDGSHTEEDNGEGEVE